MMAQQDAKQQDRRTNPDRHAFGDGMTRRFLRSLPAFRVVHDIPDHLNDLLKRLEEAERDQAQDAPAK